MDIGKTTIQSEHIMATELYQKLDFERYYSTGKQIYRSFCNFFLITMDICKIIQKNY